MRKLALSVLTVLACSLAIHPAFAECRGKSQATCKITPGCEWMGNTCTDKFCSDRTTRASCLIGVGCKWDASANKCYTSK